MPVMMPGSAIGRISSSAIASRPKKRARASAAAASVPSTSGDRRADTPPPANDSVIAAHTSSRCQATPNHCVVSAGGGKT